MILDSFSSDSQDYDFSADVSSEESSSPDFPSDEDDSPIDNSRFMVMSKQRRQESA